MLNLRTWLVFSLILFVAGCDLAQKMPPRQSGRVAVLDVIRISQETGHTDRINNEISQAQSALAQELNTLQSDLQARIAGKQQDFGTESPSDAQRQELSDMIGQAQQEYQQAKNEATQKLKQQQFDLVQAFRDELRPIAKRIANDRGMSVVVILNDAFILDHDPATDITDAVIAEMPKVSMPKASMPTESTEATEASEQPAAAN